MAKISASTTEDITLSDDLKKTVVSAKKTNSGNYILETKGAGYGIKGGDEYHPASNEYIIVRVAITPDYKIISAAGTVKPAAMKAETMKTILKSMQSAVPP